MLNDLESNTYFNNVIKDALHDLKKNKCAYVFFQEQVDTIKEIIKRENIKWNLKVYNEENLFRLEI